jgi:imidazolonepropionase
MLNMACTLFRLTPEEALAGVTRNGARALGLYDHIGTLEIGKDADFVVWNISEPGELAYNIGYNPARFIIRRGTLVKSRDSQNGR